MKEAPTLIKQDAQDSKSQFQRISVSPILLLYVQLSVIDDNVSINTE